jgi:hypothetical protein
MTLTLTLIRDEVEELLNDEFAQPVFRGGVPTGDTLVYVGTKVNPYLVLNFADIGRGAGRVFSGTRGDDYNQPINVFCVASTSDIAEGLQIKVIDKLLGFSPQYAGQLVKRGGGGTFIVTNSAGAVAAYVSMVSFTCTIQLLEIIAP